MITGVQLITGLIGAGKTLRAVSLIEKEVAAGRPVYTCNINGLDMPGVMPIDDPKRWQDLPPGSLLVVDEAQRFWRARRTAEVPPELQAMETSRHDAVSFLLLTQQPTYLDKHIRGLVTRHEHLFRRGNAEASSLYAWDRCHDEPMSPGSKDGADESIFVFPKKMYGKYKSAEQHTTKMRIGLRMKLVGVAVLFVVAVIGWIAWDLSKSKTKPTGKSNAPIASARDRAQPETRIARRGHVLNTDEYLAMQRPRVPSQPWSAPLYDTDRAAAKPAVYCMVATAGEVEGGSTRGEQCRCLTEQGTRYLLSNVAGDHEGWCRLMAREGPSYNPFLEPKGVRMQVGAPGEVAPTLASTTAQAVGMGEVAQPARYGAFRGEATGPASYEGSTW